MLIGFVIISVNPNKEPETAEKTTEKKNPLL
jgi:hypothetical protein